MINYPLEITPDDNGTFLVTCPDLPEVTTFGETEDDALLIGADAVAEALAARLHDFSPIPKPSGGRARASVGLHMSFVLSLYWAMAEAQVSRAELQRRLGWHRPQVDRLFDPNHATRMHRFEAAFRALGYVPEVSARAA